MNTNKLKEETKNSTEVALENVIMEIKDQVKDSKLDTPNWWKMIDKKDQYKIGDVVLLKECGKYAVFCGPAKKEGLVKLNIIKKQLSKGFYNRNWYVLLDEIELVKRKNKLVNNFMCTNDRIYKIVK